MTSFRAGRSYHHLLAVATLALVALVTYWPVVRDGGFVADDWPNGEWTQFGGPNGEGTVEYFWQVTKFRPALVLWVPFTHWALGENQTAHVLLSLGLAVLA